MAVLLPLAQQLAGLVPHVLVKPGDEAVLFKQGDKLSGGHEAPLGMDPAHQCLGTGDAAVLQAVFRLEVHHEFLVLEGRLHGIGDGLLPKQPGPERVVVDRQELIVFSLDAAHSQKHPVAHLLHLDGPVGDLVNAPAEHHLVVQHLRLQILPLAGEPLGADLLEEHKPIRVEPAAEAVLPRHAPEDVGDCQQQPVALPDTEGIIEQLEIFHIYANDAVVLVRVGIQTLPQLAVEEFLGIDPREPVVLK